MSFSDPPVSATKEFERDSERAKSFKSTLNRMLMRKSKTDSASELNNLELENGVTPVTGSDSDEETEQVVNRVRTAPPLDDAKIFEYLQKKYTELGDNDEPPPRLPLSHTRQLMDVLLYTIQSNSSAKEEFFQKLLLAMPQDTLHWAVKENSSYAYMTEVRKQVTPGMFNGFVVNMLKTEPAVAATMARDIGVRMDSAQKFKFISDIASEPKDKV